MLLAIERHSHDHSARRAAEVEYKSRLDLHNAEAAALRELRVMHEELKVFRWHFQTMARQAPVAILSFHQPKAQSWIIVLIREELLLQIPFVRPSCPPGGDTCFRPPGRPLSVSLGGDTCFRPLLDGFGCQFRVDILF